MMTVFEQHTHELIQSACRKIPDVTLRDLFAMSVLIGLATYSTDRPLDMIAELAYKQADAMLEARKGE